MYLSLTFWFWIRFISIKLGFGTCIGQTFRGQLEYYCPLSKHEHHHMLTHWGGRVTHVRVCKLTIIGSVNGVSLGWLQCIIWINAGILLIGPLGTDFSEILIRFQTFAFKNGLENVVCKMVATLSRRPCVKSWYIEVWWDRYAELRHFPAQGKYLSHKPKNTYVPYPNLHDYFEHIIFDTASGNTGNLDMMTSSNGNIFCVTGHLCGEFTGHRWFLRTTASGVELLCFLWSAPE